MTPPGLSLTIHAYKIVTYLKAGPRKSSNPSWGNRGAANKIGAGIFLSWLTHKSIQLLSHHNPPQPKASFIREYKNISCAQEYVTERVLDLPRHRSYSRISLSSVKNKKISDIGLIEALHKRKTNRNFVNASCPLEDLVTILRHCFDTECVQEEGRYSFSRRTSPSASGLAAIDAYVIARNVQDLQPGVYGYHNDQLIRLAENPDDYEMKSAMMDQYWVSEIPAGIILVSDLRRTWVKDISTRGYISNYLEAGHLSQNIQLVATALELHTFLSGAFVDDHVSAMLGLEEFQLPTLYVGFGASQIYDPVPEGF